MGIANLWTSVAPKCGLRIVDDFFPNPLSGFRLAEFNAYLAAFPSAEVHSMVEGTLLDGEPLRFSATKHAYAAGYPEFVSRVKRFDGRRSMRATGLYCVFLANAVRVAEIAEASSVGFGFTLYPGGGFSLNEPPCDRALERVLGSVSFRWVLATQPATVDYLLTKGFCDRESIRYVYGATMPLDTPRRARGVGDRYGFGKASLDICFAAAKNHPRGSDKGYDVFVDAARRIASECADAKFHVVGPWKSQDVDLGSAAGCFTFRGYLDAVRLSNLFAEMDVLVSPNAPFVLSTGSFDGFPTATAVEAGLCGAVVACTDPLDQNRDYVDGEDILLIPRDAQAIADTLLSYACRPERLAEIGERGRETFERLFGFEYQQAPRLRHARELLGEVGNETGPQ